MTLVPKNEDDFLFSCDPGTSPKHLDKVSLSNCSVTGQYFVADNHSFDSACDYGSLSQDKVKGRVVYCEGYFGQDYTIKQLGGIGIVASRDSLADLGIAFVMSVPGTTVSSKDGEKIDSYINSTK